MKAQYLLIAGLLAFVVHGGNSRVERNTDASTAFARLKTLVGEWESQTESGKTRLTYELTAAGTALVERESGDKMPAMTTVYFLDGDRLLLTHYCMVGNQPRMLARSYKPETGELRFEFLDATNLAKPDAGHMHNASIQFIDDNHISSKWEYFENRKLKFAEASQYTRVR
jgi:hypothetical protein